MNTQQNLVYGAGPDRLPLTAPAKRSRLGALALAAAVAALAHGLFVAAMIAGQPDPAGFARQRLATSAQLCAGPAARAPAAVHT